MPEEKRIYPRSSAFEALLAKVEMDLWNLRNYPDEFANSVREFVQIHLPSMYQDKLKEKIDFAKEFDEMDGRVGALRKGMKGMDPFDEEAVHVYAIPAEYKELAEKIWHATVDVLTDAGFNFPISRGVPRRRMGG